MRRFFRRYLVTCIIGSAAVFFGMPYALPHLQHWRGTDAADEGDGTGLASLPWKELTERLDKELTALVDELPFARDRSTSDVVLNTPVEPSPTPRTPTSLPPLATRQRPEDPGETKRPVLHSSQSVGGRPSVASAKEGPAAPPSPSPDDAQASWGVTRDNIKAYTLKGEFIEYLPGGTLIETDGRTAKSPDGRLNVCRALLQGSWSSDLLLQASSLLLRPGSIRTASPDTRKALQQFGKTRGLISAREREIKQQALDANPHATAYRRDLAAYRAFIDQVEDLTAKRDASTGADHMRYSNQLRSLKNESARLQRAFEQSKTRYLAWRSKHPIRVDPAADPQVQRLQQKLTRLEQDIRQL